MAGQGGYCKIRTKFGFPQIQWSLCPPSFFSCSSVPMFTTVRAIRPFFPSWYPYGSGTISQTEQGQYYTYHVLSYFASNSKQTLRHVSFLPTSVSRARYCCHTSYFRSKSMVVGTQIIDSSPLLDRNIGLIVWHHSKGLSFWVRLSFSLCPSLAAFLIIWDAFPHLFIPSLQLCTAILNS